MKRLNIGCGLVVADGWVNVDEKAYREWPDRHRGQRYPRPSDFDAGPWIANPLGHMGAAGLPWADESFAGAVSHHVLQMVPWPHLVPWLAEVRRVLEPGATLRLSVPDLMGAVGAYLADDRSWFPIDPAHEPSTGGALCLYLTQAGATRSVFTAGWLLDLLALAGFEHTSVETPQSSMGPRWMLDLDSRPLESIIVEGRRA